MDPALRFRHRRLAEADSVQDDLELAAGDLACVELLDRARGEVARIGERRLAGLLALAVDALELGQGHVDFAADLNDVGQARAAGGLEFWGERVDGFRVGRDVVALEAAAARDGAHERALLVGEAHGDAVDLRLDHVGEVLAAEKLDEPLVEGTQVGLGIGVVEALQRLAVPVGGEALEPVVADAGRGGIGRLELGKLRLEIGQFALQPVIFEIRDLRLRLPVIQFVVARHVDAQVGDALPGLGGSHSR